MTTSRKIILCLPLILIPLSLCAANPGDIYLRFIEGDVQLQASGTSDWVSTTINTPLLPGGRLWVPEGGKAESLLRDGTVLRLGQSSFFEILGSDTESLRLYLDRGHLQVNYAGPKGKTLAVDTPRASVHTQDRAVIRTDVTEQGDAELSVFSGEAFADIERGDMKLGAGDRLVLYEDAEPTLTALLSPDGFEAWNSQRDAELFAASQGDSSRYLPEELNPYASDFDQYGSWVSVPDYGYVWAPASAAGYWSPYRLGYWGRFHGDHVWISYEPWGWVPYHYGRWTHLRGFGWCWVPPRRDFASWAPGYVGWLQTSGHVSWVPLAPNEHYGQGHVGPRGITITNINVQKSLASMYINARVSNAVVTVQRDTFLAGRPGGVALTNNQLPGTRQIAGLSRVREIPQPRHIQSVQAAASRYNQASAGTWSTVPVQAGDISIWNKAGENGVQHYMMRNTPSMPGFGEDTHETSHARIPMVPLRYHAALVPMAGDVEPRGPVAGQPRPVAPAERGDTVKGLAASRPASAHLSYQAGVTSATSSSRSGGSGWHGRHSGSQAGRGGRR